MPDEERHLPVPFSAELFAGLKGASPQEQGAIVRRGIYEFHRRMAEGALALPEDMPREERTALLVLTGNTLDGYLNPQSFWGLDQAELGILRAQLEAEARHAAPLGFQSVAGIERPLGKATGGEQAVQKSYKAAEHFLTFSREAEEASRAASVFVEAVRVMTERTIQPAGGVFEYQKKAVDLLVARREENPQFGEEFAVHMLGLETQLRAFFVRRAGKFSIGTVLEHGRVVFSQEHMQDGVPLGLDAEEALATRQKHVDNLHRALIDARAGSERFGTVADLEAEIALHQQALDTAVE